MGPLAAESPSDTASLSLAATFTEAREKAKEDGRLIDLQFKASGRPHCRSFREKVLGSAEFQDFARKQLPLVIDDLVRDDLLSPEQAKELEELRALHSLRYTPTVVVFSPQGVEVLKVEGYKGESAGDFVSSLERLLVPKP
jgi:thioredoxin-related protein